MIYVKETLPIKISGLTSFLVYSDRYSKDFLELIKSLTVSYYFEKDYTWEISSIDLKLFLENATILDDIELTLLVDKIEEDTTQYVTKEEIAKLNFEPREHQVVAINYHLKHKKWLLLDSMGVGKTLEIIGCAEILKNRGLIDHCLIICGINSIKENWAAEIEKFGSSSYVILGKKVNKNGRVSYATVKERAQILKNPIDEFFVITNVETFRDAEIVQAFKRSKNNFGMIAIDEIHKCSNKKSEQGKHILKLDAPYLIGATGTLITNKPTSAYLPLAWTHNDKSILSTFRPQYEVQDENKRVIGYKNLDVLQEEIEACSLRRTLKDVKSNINKKLIEYEIVELNPKHYSFYKDLENGIKEQVDKIELDPDNVLALNIRLRQAVTCPSLLTSEKIEPSKLIRCKELVEEIVSNNEKVIIISFFVEPANELAKILSEYNPVVLTGQTNESDFKDGINKFKTSSNCNVLIGTHGKMGTGLSFPECRFMIMIDLPWTAAQFNQSCDRIYRLTSENDVLIKVLEAKDTIDERVREIVEEKDALQDYLVDHVDSALEKLVPKKSLNDQLKEILRKL